MEDDFKMLKKYSRAAVICVLNCTNAPIEMVHSHMHHGVHKRNKENTTIQPQKYEHFTFHNSLFTGVAGEMHFNHPSKLFRVGFENPLVGQCKGHVSENEVGTPFAKNEGHRGLKDHNSEGSAQSTFETRFKHERYPPVYTVIFQNL